MTIKTSQCGAVMHHVRNGVPSIKGIMSTMPGYLGSPHEQQVNEQIDRVISAVSNCQNFKKTCGECPNKVEIIPGVNVLKVRA